MSTHNHDTSLGNGVYFLWSDYVGIARRVVIIIVDLAILVLVYALLSVILLSVAEVPSSVFAMLYLLFMWFYLTLLKSSKLRTVGYRLAKCKILSLSGTRPSLFQMTFRLLMWVFGPFNFLVDLFWCATDEGHQTLRDRFAGTLVVREHAEPIGVGEIQSAYYTAFGFSLTYPHVVGPRTRGGVTAS